ncbi:OmpA family protein [Vitiosangium sp. GDMCC 1.1324]|uniref:OmpA family protein n=1 Tax=Vitiosangium sp. (strain GDMCC 1.1324) TaxID=2138576 RepID=UPI000D349D39|nr:OmpA family protein [Vitiosangium sp. GDMCC 1.1324]PTL85377.1 OmpA family protein [Vitiosangium sp. GDMCC 1.1324]
MRLPSSAISAAMAATLLACAAASAQSTEQLPGFDLERLETNVGRGTLLVGNGELMAPGGLSVTLLGHYQRMPLVLSDGERDLRVVQDRATALLAASYGVLPWLELSAQVPFVLWQQGDDPGEAGLAQLAAQGLGTPVLQARLGLLSRRYRQPVDLSADLGVGLPVGTGTALAGDAGPRFHARLVVGTTLGWLQPSLEAGVLFRPSILLDTAEAAAKPGASSEVRLGAALATTGQGLRGELGLRATLAPQVSMELLGGVRFPLLVGLDAFVLGGPGVGGAPGTPRFRVLAGVAFRSEPPPKLSFIDQNADHELQLSLATPKPPPEDNRIRPVGTWELNSLTRDDTSGASGESGAPQEAPRPYQPGPQERLVLRGEIHFAQGSSELPGVVPLLDQAVLRLSEQTRGGTIIVEGHADSEGTDSSNMIMSLRRAQAVRRYLIDQGVPATRVRIRGFGSNWPVSARPATEQERQLNRRAEVLVLTEVPAPTTPAAPTTTQVPAP